MEDTPSIEQQVYRGVCNLPPGSNLISDADEEIFMLYTGLAAHSATSASTENFRGLGHVDSKQDVLTISFELKANGGMSTEDSTTARSRKRTKKKQTPRDQAIEILLHQDKTALRSRKGDTGSVVWKASIDLAQALLQQHYAFTDTHLAFLDFARLKDSHILELGAGTGLLSIALSPLVQGYTVTDVEDLMPLIRKNLTLNVPNWNSLSISAAGRPHHIRTIKAEPLDWLALYNCTPAARKTLYSYDPIDLLLVVDCIYHPFILPALVHAIDYLSTPKRTAVLVVAELRADDVLREFLELWLAAGGSGVWELWHVNGLLEGPYVVWVGWKTS